MNNSTLTNIILGVLGVAVAVLFFLHFKSASPSVKLNPTAKDMASAQGSKVAFVNIDTFFSKYEDYKKFKAEIEASQQAQSGQISQQQAQSQMGSLQSRMGALQTEEQSMAKNLADKMDKATKDLYKKVEEYFNENKSKYNCDVVMGYTTNGMILYFDRNRDITNELVEDLNKN
jgi:outer membrane protein